MVLFRTLRVLIFTCFILLQSSVFLSQNQAAQWYFGQNAGLNFLTSPPSVLTNGSMAVVEGCASVSDAAGNLLFYTDGMTIWNKNHIIMGNGTGLFGAGTPVQSSLILPLPGNSN